MLQLLRKPSRRERDEEALTALFTGHDLTTRLPEQQPWMGRLNRFSDGLHQRIRTSLGAASASPPTRHSWPASPAPIRKAGRAWRSLPN